MGGGVGGGRGVVAGGTALGEGVAIEGAALGAGGVGTTDEDGAPVGGRTAADGMGMSTSSGRAGRMNQAIAKPLAAKKTTPPTSARRSRFGRGDGVTPSVCSR